MQLSGSPQAVIGQMSNSCPTDVRQLSDSCQTYQAVINFVINCPAYKIESLFSFVCLKLTNFATKLLQLSSDSNLWSPPINSVKSCEINLIKLWYYDQAYYRLLHCNTVQWGKIVTKYLYYRFIPNKMINWWNARDASILSLVANFLSSILAIF